MQHVVALRIAEREHASTLRAAERPGSADTPTSADGVGKNALHYVLWDEERQDVARLIPSHGGQAASTS
jgi:hypothetical protein